MDAKTLKSVVDEHKPFISIPDRYTVEEILYFVGDLLTEEKKYVEKHEPYAINSIKKLETATEMISDLIYTIDDIDSLDIAEAWNE